MILLIVFSLGVNSDSDEFVKLLMFYMRAIGIKVGAFNKQKLIMSTSTVTDVL